MPTRNFLELLKATPADRQRRIEKRFRKNLAATPLDQLRKAQPTTASIGTGFTASRSRLSSVEDLQRIERSAASHYSSVGDPIMPAP